ncbi:hypothetical protein TNCT1_67550 [Streptomyces sp. 1-11]|nr:hypothetical protein TNCT1_67550 [Streptomyces sp. 1-11]
MPLPTSLAILGPLAIEPLGRGYLDSSQDLTQQGYLVNELLDIVNGRRFTMDSTSLTRSHCKAAVVVCPPGAAGVESFIKLPRSLTAATTVCTSQRCALSVLRDAGLVPCGSWGGESIATCSLPCRL